VYQLIIWRTLLGFGLGGEWSSGAVLVSETWPAAHRDKAMGIMQSGWALGNLLAIEMARWILPTLGWRWLFVAGALPALLTLWLRRAVPEPAIWQERRSAATGTAGRFVALFGRDLAARTLIATLLMASVLFAYWGLFGWLPTFLASPATDGGAGLELVKSLDWVRPVQVGAFLGYLSFGFIAVLIGRRVAFIGFLTIAALLVPVYGALVRDPWWLMALGPLLGYFGHGYLSLFGSMLSEIFPTALRGTGQGFVYSSARVLSAPAPFVVGTLAQSYGIGAALTLTSAFFLAGAVLILLLPRTAGRALDE
jgi:MFS family permease